ncbi:MAG: MBL fold metallo-hydrolase [Candidatus Onthomorpha sp.]
MKIRIHRGTDQIGGCVTEYEHNGWKLFVDYGEQLPGFAKSNPLEIDGLTKGDLTKSALLITHYHGDHIGCIKELPEELPIYGRTWKRYTDSFVGISVLCR